MPKPLDGIKVVEVAQAYSGPFAAMLLADYGADVVKVEPPQGDLWRRMAETPPESMQAKAQMGSAFIMMNRNKRSIVLDLALAEAKAVFHKLVETSDVLVENMRPGQMEKLGLGYEALKDINPRLIYASVSAYGLEGAEARSRGFDQLAQARAGILSARRHADGTPVTPSVFVADLGCAMMLAYAVSLCLIERQKSGRGQKIDASLLGTALSLNPSSLVRVVDDPRPKARPNNALVDAYRCGDGRHVILSAPVPPFWPSICKAIALPGLEHDPAFARPASRLDNAEALHAVLARAFLSRPSVEWVRRFDDAGVPCALVQEPDEVFDDPQVRANELMIEHEHPALGRVRMPGLPFSLSRTDGEVRRGAPLLGEHTHAILEEMGYSKPDIVELERLGATRIAA